MCSEWWGTPSEWFSFKCAKDMLVKVMRLCLWHLFFKRSMEVKSCLEDYDHTLFSHHFLLSMFHSNCTSSERVRSNEGVLFFLQNFHTLSLFRLMFGMRAFCAACKSVSQVVWLKCSTGRHGRKMNPGVFWGCIASAWWSACWSCCCCQLMDAGIWCPSPCISASATAATSSWSLLEPTTDEKNRRDFYCSHDLLTCSDGDCARRHTALCLYFHVLADWGPARYKTARGKDAFPTGNDSVLVRLGVQRSRATGCHSQLQMRTFWRRKEM